MRTSGELKDIAISALEGKWGQAVGLTFVMAVLESVASGLSYIPIVGAVFTLVAMPLSFGFAVAFLNNLRGGEARIETLFAGYKDFGRVFLTQLIMCIYVCLWSLLLVVPGVIKAISYTMTSFVLNDNPKLSYDAAISRSSRLMQGHKMEYFVFVLSFAGWFVLSVLTMFIGFLWLAPYFQTAKAAFYHELLAEHDEDIAVVIDDDTMPAEGLRPLE